MTSTQPESESDTDPTDAGGCAPPECDAHWPPAEMEPIRYEPHPAGDGD